ncbi:MAG: restriction endonuclease [Gammaproteobacteria bacterium]|nr:restriction endonuclease [Gammaproteobacteria bacterium]
MSINPFLMPFLFSYHHLGSFEDLVDLIIASHLMTGHNTSFGKLVDEKIVTKVFGAQKLDVKFRRQTAPFGQPCFDEIDHIITREDGKIELLSLKAGRWTIQLTMAVQLNVAFKEITEKYPDIADNIVVGVFYGNKEDLTDKYDILRGINRGAVHNVHDLTHRVHIYSGREFWTWLSGGAEETQEWVLKGICEALNEEKIHETSAKLLEQFKTSVVEKYEADVRVNGIMDWKKLLSKING